MIKSRINFLLIFFALAIFSNCAEKTGKIAGFSDVCRMEDHEIVEMEGFLHLQKSSDSTSAFLSSNQFLLVENQNGSGGFIEILMFDTNRKDQQFSNENRVKITGEVIKEEKSFHLKIVKIEAP